MDFKYLLFDFDNTLVDFHDSSHKAFAKTFKAHDLEYSNDIYQKYKIINKGIWSKFEKGEITTDDIRRDRFAQLFELLNITHLDPVQFNASYIDDIIFYTELYPGVRQLLNNLEGRFRMSIVTNGLKEAQRARIKKVSIENYFSEIIVSDEIGFAKPDSRYFDIVHEQIGEPNKEEVLVIGDNLKSDILGANDFGYKSCWIGTGEHGNEINPDYVIEKVSQLPGLLNIYKNIACHLYDELELKAVEGKQVKISYIDSNGSQKELSTKINTLETVQKEEFLVTNEGLRIRLDKLIKIDQVEIT